MFVTEALRSDTGGLDACYALMQATFPADELVNRAEYEFLLQAAQSIAQPHWFAILARREQATQQLAGMIAGSYMQLEAANRLPRAVGMIEYLAIAPHHQQQGHGRALLTAFEQLMRQYAGQRAETLRWLVGEVDDDLLPFKFRLGYGLPATLAYVQPPIEFDAVGKPIFAAVPKQLVLKPMAQQGLRIDAAELKIIIQTIYRWRYVPVLGEAAAQMQAAAYLEQHIMPHVFASVGAGVIPLRQTIPP